MIAVEVIWTDEVAKRLYDEWAALAREWLVVPPGMTNERDLEIWLRNTMLHVEPIKQHMADLYSRYTTVRMTVQAQSELEKK